MRSVMFSLVQHSEWNLKRTHGSARLQLWLGTCCAAVSSGSGRSGGYAEMAQVRATIETEQAEASSAPSKKAA